MTTTARYPLGELRVDVALFYGSDDPTSASVAPGRALLPPERVVFERNVTGYGHADFTWGIDAHRTFFPDLERLFGEANGINAAPPAAES